MSWVFCLRLQCNRPVNQANLAKSTRLFSPCNPPAVCASLPPRCSHCPQTVKFDEVEVFKVGTTLRAGASMLPLGMTASADPLKVSVVQPSVALENSVLAVRSGGENTTNRHCLRCVDDLRMSLSAPAETFSHGATRMPLLIEWNTEGALCHAHGVPLSTQSSFCHPLAAPL